MNNQEEKPKAEGMDGAAEAEQPAEVPTPEEAPAAEAGEKPAKDGVFGKRKAEKIKEEFEKKLAEAEEKLAKQKDQLLRTAAEYDNFRKRTEREKSGIYSDATAAAVKEFLPVADNMERALAQEGCTAEDLRKGVEMVNVQLLKALEALGVTTMGETGEPFDPAVHNAVSHVDDESLGENVIAQVYQKGYKIGDKVVRHATVVVAN